MPPWNTILPATGLAACSVTLWFWLASCVPVVTSMTPPNGAEGVAPDAPLAVSFSQPMAPETIHDGTIVLRNGNGAHVPADVSYDASRRIAAVTPRSPLQAGTAYELRVGGEAGVRPSGPLGLPLRNTSRTRFTIMEPPEAPGSARAPILVVTDPGNPFGAYYAEILRAEGLNLFETIDILSLTPERLASADIVILTTGGVTADVIAQFDPWIRSGGNLVAIRPEGELLPLLGLTEAGPPVQNGYLFAAAATRSGRGITQETLQLRVPASRFDLQDGVPIAHLFASSAQRLPHPAISLRQVGLGYAAAFAYDLAQSVIRTRQGNPGWANQERDSLPPRRANDLFYPDDIDMAKIGVPQADEQQRLFANLLLIVNHQRRPLPRFWYLPEGRKVALIMAGDDHGTKRGTTEAFAQLEEESPHGCRLDAWECYRATSYLTIGTSIPSGQIERYAAAGFELGIHTDTGCMDRSNAEVALAFSTQVNGFGQWRMGGARQETHRMHCLAWNGWVDTAKIARTHGIRLSLDYYYWPGSWIKERPGYMTGSGFPMRFADVDGTVLDIYQATTHLVDENGVDQTESVRFLIDRALGPEQFFGAFGTHYDYTDGFFKTLVSVAREREVALISAAQMLRWLDARDASRFDHVVWEDNVLSFSADVGAGAQSMTAMLPLWASGHRLTVVECEGAAVSYREETIKGLEYALFPVESGTCRAIYEEESTSAASPTIRME